MIQVREYATLSSRCDGAASLDLGFVSEATLNWLLELQQKQQSGLLSGSGRNSVKLGSYVGYLQSPNGECIEILPKTQRQLPSPAQALENRRLLREMLLTSLQLKSREADAASLQRLRTPLHEWIFTQFLDQLSQLVRHGLRFDYQRVEEESRFIRGRLDQTRQSRQTPDRATWFHIQHDIYSPQRIENRLLKTALDGVLKLTRNPDNWRLANELAHQMIEIAPCHNPLADLPKWQSGKLMQTYDAVKPWCALILEKLNPSFQRGRHRGIALLFPMERLFENYVAHWLKRQLAPYSRLRTQACNKHLLRHKPEGAPLERGWFQLRPDLLLETCLPGLAPVASVMDSKWKLLDNKLASSDSKYNLSQADMYQLYAYGQQYMNGAGHMALIFPAHADFQAALPRFSFSKDLHLWALPFDLKRRQLVPGAWLENFPGLRACVDREAV
ncbi:McrC family protein [Microbulbifer halophilus]|uniref:McrC family protein n=1 Tax=Microbulbifer halophilus TaxID=453963 RepID=A0ABW5EEP6_9GAMM|nr:McrC family protein [Microbulbifer halophilus]MCW8127887.1 McrC family protein [Microbulbifer halophilus]